MPGQLAKFNKIPFGHPVYLTNKKYYMSNLISDYLHSDSEKFIKEFGRNRKLTRFAYVDQLNCVHIYEYFNMQIISRLTMNSYLGVKLSFVAADYIC